MHLRENATKLRPMINHEIFSKTNDPDALKALVLELLKIAQQFALWPALKIQAITQAKAAVQLNKAYIEKLKLKLAHLKRARFGSKSEAFNSTQGKLFEGLHVI